MDLPTTHPTSHPLLPPAGSLLLAAAVALSGHAIARAEWQNFRTADGMPDNQALAIFEASDGAMWFGTPAGAARYDGARWNTTADSLRNRTVLALLEDRRGRWWFGTQNGGLSRFDGSHWTHYDPSNSPLPSNQIESALEDDHGDLWFGTPAGLARLATGTEEWTVYRAGADELIHSHAWRLLEDSRRRLWVATPEGVSCLDSARVTWTRYAQDPAALARDSVLCLAEDAQGNVWFGTDQGAFRFDGAAWTRYLAADGLPGPIVTGFAADAAGGLWAGGYLGVSRFDGKTWRPQPTTSTGASLGQVLSLAADRSGNLWIGTAGAGLFRSDGVAWRHYFSSRTTCSARPQVGIPSLANVLAGNCVSAMLQDAAGDLWLGSYDGGVARLDRTGCWCGLAPGVRLIRRSASVPLSDSNRVILEDRDANLWFGSNRAGVARLDRSRTAWTLFLRANGLAGDSINAIYQDSAGDVWVGTNNGASRHSGGAWQSYLRGGVGGVVAAVRQIVEDRAGYLWLRTTAGLHRLDPTRATIERFGAADGIVDSVGTALIVSRTGALWLRTARGLHRYQDGGWTVVREFGAPDTVGALYEDREGGIWVGSDYSVARFDGGSWISYSAVELGGAPVTGVFQDRGGSIWLANSDGLGRWNGEAWRSYNSRGGGLPADGVTGFLEDTQGRLWFASNAGLAEHEPDRTAPQTIFVDKPADLNPSRNVSFVFGAAYGEASDVEYSVAWDGGSFSPWTAENAWSLGGVPDSAHAFEVRSRDWARNEDPTPARFTFVVDATPPTPVLSAPRFGQPVAGTVAIEGTASDPRFREFAVEARPVGTASWTAPEVVVITRSSEPVEEGALGTWDTAPLADGDYELRVAVADALGLVGASLIRVIVDNHPPFAGVTSPARVTAADGGHVYTTDAEVHLYFPPHAFDVDARVTIEPVTGAAVPDALPSGASRASAAYDVSWGNADLRKDGVLEMRADAPPPPGRSLAAYQEEAAGWVRLGGTREPGERVAMPLTGPGRYAIFAEAGSPDGAGTLAAVTLSPRVFSPTGGFANPEIAIGFALGQAAGVTVKVYNRAGRLVRSVANGLSLGPGSNLVRWDGRDRDGEIVQPGVYIVSVEALGQTRTETLAVVR